MHEVRLPFGPQHPSIKEPIFLSVDVEGEVVRDASMRLGYAHRGAEKMVEGKSIMAGLFVTERICGLCSSAHSNCYVQAFEKLLPEKPGLRVALTRVVIGELERIHSHLLWLGFLMHEIGFESLFMLYWSVRESVLNLLEKISGNRIHHSNNWVGSVRSLINKSLSLEITNTLDAIKPKLESYAKQAVNDRVIRSRLVSKGVLSEKDAEKLCLVGPLARASGINNDVRSIAPYEAYSQLKFKVPLSHKCDAMARLRIRLEEINTSISMVKQALALMPESEVPALVKPEISEGCVTARVEAPRGELFHYYEVKNGLITRARFRTPTYANIICVPQILQGYDLSDVPVIIASLDPCFSCMDRVLVVKDGHKRIMNSKELMRE